MIIALLLPCYALKAIDGHQRSLIAIPHSQRPTDQAVSVPRFTYQHPPPPSHRPARTHIHCCLLYCLCAARSSKREAGWR